MGTDGATTAQHTTWDGAFNLRDLGGLSLAGGGATVSGRVFRSGSREYVTTTGWKQASAAGLRTVVDMRNAPAETARLPFHPTIEESVMESFCVLNRPTEDQGDEHFMTVCGPWLDHPRSYAKNVAFYPAKFAAVFRAIAESPGPVLIHCAGGRDRTGMVVAMLLSLTGVRHDAIVDDYEVAVRAVNAHLENHHGDGRETAHTAAHLDERIAERRAALATWLSSFDADAYLASAGLGQAEILRLRQLLRPSPAS